MQKLFRKINNVLEKNKGKDRCVHILFSDGTDQTIIKISSNEERSGYVDVQENYVYWEYGATVHATPLSSIIDVCVDIF